MASFSFAFALGDAGSSPVAPSKVEPPQSPPLQPQPPVTAAITAVDVPCPSFAAHAHFITADAVLLVDLGGLRLRRVASCVVPDVVTPTGQATDLLPGIYEGGYKVWECSVDVARIIHEDVGQILAFEPATVLELGCGAALPALAALSKYNRSVTEAVLTDFNRDVLEAVTWPNVVLNLGPDPAAQQRVRCIAGDWLEASAALRGRTFDLVLSAETLYNDDCCHKVFKMLEEHLDPARGVALIASKRYYFGVGGGTFDFIKLVEAPDSTLVVERVACIEDTVSNIRDVLKVTKKQKHVCLKAN